jgi:hypothetical protein
MNMKKIALASLVVASALVGCSGGGSGSSMAQNSPVTPVTPTPAPAPKNQARFVNATPDLGPLDFTMGTIHYTVAPRGASPVFTVTPGPATVVVSNGAKSGSRQLTIPDTAEVYIVSGEHTAGMPDSAVILGKVPDASPAFALVTYYNETPGPSPPLEDFYVVPPGGSIAGVDPTVPGAGASGRSIGVGTYSFVVTPAGKKTILFQSGPVTLAAGQQMVLIGAPVSQYVLTPQPIVAGLDDAIQSLADSRPSVTLLRRIDAMIPFAQDTVMPGMDGASTFSIDGDTIVQLPSATAAAGVTYHLTPGNHNMASAGATIGALQFIFNVDANAGYTERYGYTGFSFFDVGNAWLAPDVKVDYPIPADRARVRLVVELGCGLTSLVRIDGTAITYGSQGLGNPGIVFDHAPGTMQVQLTTSDGASEGTQIVALDSGHYYVVRAPFIPIDPADECPGLPLTAVLHPYMEVSSD